MIQTQVVSAEVAKLADAVAAAIDNEPDRFALVEGEITLIAHREAEGFTRLNLQANTRLAPRRQRFSDAQLKRLARDARAKILAEASAIDPKVRVVTLRIHARGEGYVIALGVER